MAEIDRMLEANREWATRFPGSKPVQPARKVAVVACMDSRIPLFGVLGLDIGDAHVIRNAGGVITEDVIRSLTISQHAPVRLGEGHLLLGEGLQQPRDHCLVFLDRAHAPILTDR